MSIPLETCYRCLKSAKRVDDRASAAAKLIGTVEVENSVAMRLLRNLVKENAEIILAMDAGIDPIELVSNTDAASEFFDFLRIANKLVNGGKNG